MVPQTYTFRRMTVRTSLGPQMLIAVTNQKSGAGYSVTQGKHGPRCNCGDFIHRCRGTQRVCKHVRMAQAWLASQTHTVAGEPQPAQPTEAERREAYLKQRAKDFRFSGLTR